MIFLLEPLLLVGDEELIELLPLELQLVLGILLDAFLIRVVLQNLSRKLNKKSNKKGPAYRYPLSSSNSQKN
jgi:hypothetical protein